MTAQNWLQPLTDTAQGDISYEALSHLIDEEVHAELWPVHRQMLLTMDRERIERPLAACFTPGFSEKSMHALEQFLLSEQKFQLTGRWTETGNNGPGIPQGVPITLTYSFAPDGTPINGFIGEPAGPSNLFELMNGIYGAEEEWMPLIHSVFERWGELSGVTYIYEPNDDGAMFTNIPNMSKGLPGVRGDIRIGGHPIDGPSGVLAYNFYPGIGDMVLDTTDLFAYSDRTNNSLRLRNIIAHEHGHGLGFNHSCPIDKTKLMEPFLSTNFDGPQHDEIRGVQRYYDDRHILNDHPAYAADLGAVSGTLTVANMGIRGKSDVDYYRFRITQPSALDVSIRAVGKAYTIGTYSSGTCNLQQTEDSSAAASLHVRLYSADGTWLMEKGVLKGGSFVFPPRMLSSGEWLLRVCTNGQDAVQTYDLNITAAPILSAEEADLSISLQTSTEVVSPGDKLHHLVTVRNDGPGDADAAQVVLRLPPEISNATLESLETSNAHFLLDESGAPLAVLDLPAESEVTFSLRSIASTNAAALLSVDAHVLPAIETLDPNLEGNHAVSLPVFVQAPGLPRHGELFTSFPGLNGSAGKSAPGAFPSGYTLAAATSGPQGFAALEGIAPQGNALAYIGGERGIMTTSGEFSSAHYSSDSHQLAFNFRFSAASTTNSFSHLATVRNRNAEGMAYLLRVGRGADGLQGASIMYPGKSGGAVIASKTIPLAPDVWHQAVVQYTSPFTRAPEAGGGQLRVWFNPTSDGARPDLLVNETELSAQHGAGSIGAISVGAAWFSPIISAPTVYLSRVGLWNGPPVPEINDLPQAMSWLNGEQEVPDAIAEREAVLARLLGMDQKASDLNANGIIDAADMVVR